jgi:hypothetical protein
MSRRSVPRGLVLSIAFFGVFVGHALTYIALARNPVVRSTMLQATGHSYLPVTVHAALALAVVGLAGIFLAGLGRDTDAGPSRAGLIGRVSTFQVLTFAAIEVAERIAAHAPLHDLTHVLPVGTVVQFAVAFVVAAVIRLVLRAADTASDTAIAALTAPPHALIPLVLEPAASVPHRGQPVLRVRGPPR